MQDNRRGMLIVLSGPAGVGKGTLGEMLRAEDGNVVFSVSATTRAPRAYEQDGVHYHFLTEERFAALVEEDAFLEHARVHAHSYGTLKSEVFARLERGQDVLLDIDTQGAKQVMARMPECVSVFILPQSFDELRERLLGRGTETPEQVELRMRNARAEVAERSAYQYFIVNRTGEIESAFRTLKAIVEAERHRAGRFSPVVGGEAQS